MKKIHQLCKTPLNTRQIPAQSTTAQRLGLFSRHPTMGSFLLQESNPTCPINFPPAYDLSEDKIMAFKPFNEWISKLQHSIALQESNKDHPFHSKPYKLRSIDIQAIDRFGDRIGFMKLFAKITNDDGELLPGAMFLRGASVAMMIILQPDDVSASSDDDKHVLLTIQPRVAACSFAFVELPAGMLDDSGTFAGAAAKEIKEECGLEVAQDQLINISELAASRAQTHGDEQLAAGVFPSAGGCDEYIPIFLWQKRVKREELKGWEGKLTGLRDEGEKITLKLVKLKDLWKEGSRDSKSLSALALYHGLRTEGII